MSIMTAKQNLTTRDLLNYLKSLEFKSGLIDRLKVYYRPLVCPFTDLIKLVKDGESIGDIGCGSGQFCLLLAQFANPASVYGIEINERLVENAIQLFKKHSKVPYCFEKFDGSNFPDKISELDVLFLNDVLHHVPKNMQEQFISSLIAKMKPGTRLIVKDINGESLFVYFNKLHDLIFAGEIGNELSFKTTQSLLLRNNTSILQFNKKRMYVYPHYTIVAKKQ